jgi:alpha-L-rhamnosidase
MNYLRLIKPFALIMLLSALLGLTASAHADAQWIWQAEAGPANGWVAFRKTVTLDQVPATAVATLSADTKYWLWVNGRLVVSEGGAGRGPSQARPWDRQPNMWKLPATTKPTDSWSEDVDLAGYLRPGENTIAVLVWYCGRETNKGTHIDSGQGGLNFHAQLGAQSLDSDASWKVRQHPAYAVASGDNGTSIVAYPVKFDARLAMGDWTDTAWQQPGYDDHAWTAATEKGTPPTAPWYHLVKREVPRLVDHGLQDYPSHPATRFPLISDGTEIRCDLPVNRQITPYLEIEAEAGREIVITTDDPRNKITGHYTTRAGRQAFESYSWMNGHTILYRIPAGVKVLGLKYRWQSVGEIAGSFTCSDPFYQRLWEMGRNTLFVCARDNFMDCPDRERALWIGDVSDQAGYLFYLMDGSGRALLRQAIRSTMAFSDKGVFGALGPLRIRELPSQSLQFIPQAIWEYYLNTGDTDTLRYAYPYAHAYLALWKFRPDGLPIARRGGPDSWDWYDWGTKETEDKELIQCVLYYQALQGARTIALALGESQHLAWYDEHLAAIRASFDRTYWHDDHYTSAPGKLADDRGNALAILSGLADPAKAAQIVHRVLIPNQYCSPHFEWMVEDAMSQAGFPVEALKRMHARYASQVAKQGMTTLYESFPNGGSYNHAWNAPNTVIAKHITGIVPLQPGWSEFAVLPSPLHFTSLHQVVPSVRGDITFQLDRDPASTRIHLIAPATTTALVGIPLDRGPLKKITLNGVIVWADGATATAIPGVSYVNTDSTHVRFHVSNGDWNFTAQ